MWTCCFKKQVTSLVHSAKTTYFIIKITKTRANNCLALPASCCLELNLHQYHLHCLLINSLIFIANFSWTRLEILEINLTATHLLIHNHHSTVMQSFMTLLLRISSHLLQSRYSLYSRSVCLNHMHLTLPNITAWMPWRSLASINKYSQHFLNIWNISVNLQDGHCKTSAKKSTLDPNDMNNYRPVSNLSFLSKVLEKVVLVQVFSLKFTKSQKEPVNLFSVNLSSYS